MSDALQRNEWPYDKGDDPSFFSQRWFRGNLTWGICRQQVRNRIQPGDIVVFFSFRRRKPNAETEYRLCAIATVERKLRQTDIFSDPGLRLYRRYLNLLIRKGRSGDWEHYERASPEREWHKDWVWRIADHAGNRKTYFQHLNAAREIPPTAALNGHRVAIAANYVVFSADPAETFVLAEPPFVARSERAGLNEEWNTDRTSQAVKNLTVALAKERGGRGTLRTRNLQRAHPCDRWVMSPEEARRWRELLIIASTQPGRLTVHSKRVRHHPMGR